MKVIIKQYPATVSSDILNVMVFRIKDIDKVKEREEIVADENQIREMFFNYENNTIPEIMRKTKIENKYIIHRMIDHILKQKL